MRSQRWLLSVCVVECYVGGVLAIAPHRCQFGSDWFVVFFVGFVDGVVVGAVKCGEYVRKNYDG